jgi:HicB family
MGSSDGNSGELKRFGGRVLVRMPTSLHRELVEAAKAESVSLNQFVCSLLASGVRWRQSSDASSSAIEVPIKKLEAESDNSPGDEAFSRFWRNRLA